MQALMQCHKDHTIAKWWGACNDAHWALTRCLAEEKKIIRWVVSALDLMGQPVVVRAPLSRKVCVWQRRPQLTSEGEVALGDDATSACLFPCPPAPPPLSSAGLTARSVPGRSSGSSEQRRSGEWLKSRRSSSRMHSSKMASSSLVAHDSRSSRIYHNDTTPHLLPATCTHC